MNRTMISTTEVDPMTGAGIPGTGGFWTIETHPCPNTCTGSITRMVSLVGVRYFPCSNGCW